MAYDLPNHIIKKLSRRSFNNFDQFSQTFWMAIAEDPIYSHQFIPSQLNRIKRAGLPARPSVIPQKACVLTRSAISPHPNSAA